MITEKMSPSALLEFTSQRIQGSIPNLEFDYLVIDGDGSNFEVNGPNETVRESATGKS